MSNQKCQTLKQKLHQHLWLDSWTKTFAWVKVTVGSLGTILHTLANDEHFRDALGKFNDIPNWVWLGLAILGAITWASAEHE